MSSAWAAGLAAVVAIVGSARAAPIEERRDDALPRYAQRVVGVADGGSLVLGRSSQQLVRISPDRSVRGEAHPPAGALLELRASGDELWTLGTEAALHRRGTGPWNRIPLAPQSLEGEAIERAGEIAPLAEGKAAFIRTIRDRQARGETAVTIADSAGGVEASFVFPGIRLAPAEPDGQGGLWTVAQRFIAGKEDLRVGFAHYDRRRWILWRDKTYPPPPPGFEVREVDAMPVWTLERLARDGAAGCLGLGLNGVSRVVEDGTPVRLPPLPGRSLPADVRDETLVFDPTLGQVVVLSLPHDPWNNWDGKKRRGSIGRLTRIGPRDRVVSAEDVPLPAWLSEKWAPTLDPHSVYAAGDSVWASAGPLILHRGRAGWTALWPGRVEQEMRRYQRREAVRAVLEPVLYGFFLAVGAAAAITPLAAARMRRERFRRTLWQAITGALFGGVPAALLFDAAPDYRPDFAFLAILLGVAFGTLVGGVATASAGEWQRASRRPGLGTFTAIFGAFVGCAAAVFASAALHDALPDLLGSLPVGLGAGLVGAFATLGFQLGGGGEQPRSPEAGCGSDGSGSLRPTW